MRQLINNPGKASREINAWSAVVVLFSFFLFACQKSAILPVEKMPINISTINDGTSGSISNFHLSASKLVLLQNNASRNALTVSWIALAGKNINYTVEAATVGSSFADPIEVGSTDQPVLSFSVQDFNSQMSRLLYVNNTGVVEFRVRADIPNSPKPVYSGPVAMGVTTYLAYTEYDDTKMFKIPGNYQNWIMATAPKIITKGNGEYEGYVNFSSAHPQFVMVQGVNWTMQNTFYNIGKNKFGFNGIMMSLFQNAGVYLVRANTNANTWECTKINNWVLNGTAVPANGGAAMSQDEADAQWSVTVNLVKGSFRFRANNGDAISFGQNEKDQNGVPGYDGNNIEIKQPGNYTVKLTLQNPGNYAYSISKNN